MLRHSVRSALSVAFLVAVAPAVVQAAPQPLTRLYENSSGLPFLDFVRSAQRTVDVEIYDMSSSPFRAALVDVARRGVKVRILHEPQQLKNCDPFTPQTPVFRQPQPNAGCLELVAMAREIRKAGGEMRPFATTELCADGKCLQHGKLTMVDAGTRRAGAMLSTGNYGASNFCEAAANPSRCNREYTFWTGQPRDAALLAAIYERDFVGKRYDLGAVMATQPGTALTASPLSFEPLVRLVRAARERVQVQNQYVTEPQFAGELMAAARRGVKVELNVASVCAFGPPSEAEKAQYTQMFTQYEAAGIRIRMFTQKIPVGGRPGYLHAKAMVVDDRWGWVGSVNGSSWGIFKNREFGSFFETADVAKLSAQMNLDFNHPGAVSWQDSIACKFDRPVGQRED